MGPKLCKTLEIRLECMRVCVYVWNSVLKVQNVLTILLWYRSNTYQLRCQDDIFSRIELFPSIILSSEKANYKNDIQ